MREFHRLPIECASCGAKIYNWVAFRDPEHVDDKNDVDAHWGEPPKPTETCPRCGNQVDTISSYPFVAGFPPSFESLRKAYDGFLPKWERSRRSFEAEAAEFLKDKSLEEFEVMLNSEEGLKWFKQRMFYRSATAFYRSLQLFLGYLTLDHHSYITWAKVTAYYSRFYFIQAFLNLILSTHLPVGKKASIFFDGTRVLCKPDSALPKAFHKGSHEIWWSLMEALKAPDFPCESLGFILGRLVFNPDERNTVNYGYEYLGGGFIELEWFDSGAEQMLSHFMPRPRADQDITNIDRFFEGKNPENVDVGDFYGDEAQIIWRSLVGYLQLLKSLGFSQEFVKTETIIALCDLHIGSEYTALIQGIAKLVDTCLQDGFDLESFLNHYQSSEHPESLTSQWLLRGGQFYPKTRGL
jgi:hypothetical protein